MAYLIRDEGKIFFQVSGPAPKQKSVSSKSKKNSSESHVPTLLMLRGLGRSSRYWLGFDRIMSRHFRVVTIDPRGIGRSTMPMQWSDGLDELADDCIAVLDQIEVDKFHIYGLSLGGMIASVIATKTPERVESLMIGASSSADYRALRVSASLLPKLLVALRSGRFQDALLEACVPDLVRRSWGPEIQSAWQDILKLEGFPLLTVLKQLRAAVPHSLRGKLDDADFPILFVHGSMDLFVPLKNSRELNKLIPNSVLKIVKGAGHEISLGFEEELAKILRDFAIGSKKQVSRA